MRLFATWLTHLNDFVERCLCYSTNSGVWCERFPVPSTLTGEKGRRNSEVEDDDVQNDSEVGSARYYVRYSESSTERREPPGTSTLLNRDERPRYPGSHVEWPHMPCLQERLTHSLTHPSRRPEKQNHNPPPRHPPTRPLQVSMPNHEYVPFPSPYPVHRGPPSPSVPSRMPRWPRTA